MQGALMRQIYEVDRNRQRWNSFSGSEKPG